MSAKKHFLTAFVLLSCCMIIASCGSDTVAPAANGEAPILPPATISAAPSIGGVVLTWPSNTQSHLLGYNVYRREIGNDTVYKLTEQPIMDTSFNDVNIRWGRKYEYSVTSISVGGAESNIVTTVIQLPSEANNKRERSGS